MDALCPNCSHWLYRRSNCSHLFDVGRCTICHWDGSVSEFVAAKKRSFQHGLIASRLAVVLFILAAVSFWFALNGYGVVWKWISMISILLGATSCWAVLFYRMRTHRKTRNDA